MKILSPKKQTTNADKDWGKRDPYIPLVGMYITSATMEISMEVHQETKNRITI
jgi:hypothetical protein